jgi:hypothetical protein
VEQVQSSCGGSPRYVARTTDGGATWGDWGTGVPPARTAFADGTRAFTWWDSGVQISEDPLATWKYTGHPPVRDGALVTVHVLDRDHSWVIGYPHSGTVNYVSRWVP